MSDANIDKVRGLYDAFLRGDIATIIGALAPDATWEITGRRKDHPVLGRRDGQQGAQEFFRTLAETQEATDFSPRSFHSSGDKVFVMGHYGWKMRKTGRTVDSDWIHVFTLKGDKVVAFREFTDTAQFAEAVRA
jgi:ketosteroid isomerase-like protein